MAMIHLKEGGNFFGSVKDYDWKGKFLVVEIDELRVGDRPEFRIISWDNVESVYDTDYKEKDEKWDGPHEK